MSEEIENPIEHVEHAEHARHDTDGEGLGRKAAASLAVMAIVAAALANQVEMASSHALGLKNEAVLEQARASDQWGFFQAKSLKKNVYAAVSEVAAPGGKADHLVAEAKRFGQEEETVKSKAEALEERSHELWAESAHYTHRQHTLSLAETLAHVAIAIGSMAILTRRRYYLWGAWSLVVVSSIATLAAFL